MKNHIVKRKISLVVTLILSATFSFSQKQLLNKTYPKLVFSTLLQSPLASATAKNFDNKVVVLEFWATWCSPCLANVPHINEVQNHFKNDTSVVFISITDQKKETISKFLAKRNLKGWVACDTEREMHNAFGVDGIPHTFIINQQGIVIYDGRPEGLNTKMLNQIKKGKYKQKSRAPSSAKAKLFGSWGGGDDPIYTANFKTKKDGLIPFQHTIRKTVMPNSGGSGWLNMGDGGIGITIINANISEALTKLTELNSSTRVENHSSVNNGTHWDIIFSRKNGYTLEKARTTIVQSLKEALNFNLKDTIIKKEILEASVPNLTKKMKKETTIDWDDPASKSYFSLEKLLNMYEEKSGNLTNLKHNNTDIYIDVYGEMKKLFTMDGKKLKKWLNTQGVTFTTKNQPINILWMY
jgi:thiol-disulfide isomerase/thioredoxin